MDPVNFPVSPVNRTPAQAAGSDVKVITPHAAGRQAVPVPHPPILSGPPNLWSLWASFRARWRLAVGLGLLAAVLAGAPAWFFTSSTTYTAAATLHADLTQPYLWRNPNPYGTGDVYSFQRAQVGAIKSRMIATAALRDPKVAALPVVREKGPNAIEWLQDEIQGDFAVSPETLRISATGPEPEVPLLLVKAVQEAYVSLVVKAEQTGRRKRLEQLKEQQAKFAKSLDEQRKNLEAQANAAQVHMTKNERIAAQEHDFALRELAANNSRLLELQLKLRELKLDAEAAAAQAKKSESEKVPDAAIEERLNRQLAALGYDKKVEELEYTLADYRKTMVNATAQPNYQRVEGQLAGLRKKIDEERRQLRPKVEAQVREEWLNQAQAEESGLQQQIARLAKLEDVVKKRVYQQAGQLDEKGKQTLRLENLRTEISAMEELSLMMQREIKSQEIESEAPERIRPQDEPYVVKNVNQGFKYAGVAAVGGFLAVAFGISLLEFRSRRVYGAGDVSLGLRLPVVGTLPLVRNRGPVAPSQPGHGNWQQLLLESVDSARTLLLHEFRRKNHRVVMITSAGSGEGKTLLSAHLAASLTRAGCRVLLVDGDLRRPSLHKVFGIEENVGLGEALRGEANFRDLAKPGPVNGLSVVPAGRGCVQSLRCLAQGKLGELFNEVRPDYDFIIVDSAPVLPVADSQLMAQAVDGVILSVLQNVSRLPYVYAAYERLMHFDINLYGVVIHGASVGAYEGQYPYLPLPSAAAAASKKAE